jgi:hypothetical protein
VTTLTILGEQSLSNDNSDEPKKKRKSGSDDADELRAVAEALPELFAAINTSVPQLISNLIGSIYSPEAAGNMAAGIGKFYTNLIAEGIPEDVALDMTKKFVGALDFSKIMSMVSDEASVGRKKRRRSDPEDEYLDDEEYE